MNPIQVFFALLIGHALADFALQSDSMARGKNRHSPNANLPPGQKPNRVWPYWLGAHALIHGGFVWAITGSAWLGLCETLIHLVIDAAKCEGITNIHEDQGLHVAFKIIWVVLA